MRSFRSALCAGLWLVMGGCSGPAATQHTEQVGSALGTAAGAAVGHIYDETGIGSQVGSSLGSVAGSVAGSALETQGHQAPAVPAPAAVPVKLCPVGGETYTAPYKYCPKHGVELRDVTAQPLQRP